MVMKIKVSDATGSALDWMVAKCEGHKVDALPALSVQSSASWAMYSTNWAQGGPIIEREITKIFRNVGGTWSAMILKDVPIPPEYRGTSLALTQRMQWNAAGATPLIAAMRGYVTSKLGEEVDIPEELL